jgi:hypothetical protein
MGPAKSRFSNSRGFSLPEVVISMGLLTAVSLGVAQMFAASARATSVGRGQTSAIALADQKMEQIRSLTFGFDLEGLGLPLTDTTTNLAKYPHAQDGGGLNPSPAGVLDTNTPGFVDFLDARGAWLGTGATPPDGAVYVRRWAIQPLPTNPNNTLIVQVFVSTLAREATRTTTTGPRKRLPGDALIVSVKTRKAS